MIKWLSLNLDRQFTIFFCLLVFLHLFSRSYNSVFQYAWFLLIPFLFMFMNLANFFFNGFYNSKWEFKYLLIILLYLMIPLKAGFTYYNILFPLVLVLISAHLVFFSRFKIHTLRSRIALLACLNVALIITPDISIFKYYHSVNKVVWGSPIDWANFKSKVPSKNHEDFDAYIYLSIYYKHNQVYNFNENISIAVMQETLSWVRPGLNFSLGSLLKHEQLHFDIAEWTRREFQDSLNNCKSLTKSKAKDIYRHYISLASERQIEYDSISDHSRDFVGQIIWNKKVASELK